MRYELALPEIVLIAAGLALLMLGVFRRDNPTRLVAWLSVAALTVAGVLVLAGPAEGEAAFGGLFVVDRFAVFLKVLVLAGSALSIIMALDFVEREHMSRFEFPILMVFATLGMLMMLSANDLIALYIGLELQNLALYVVASFQRDSLRSTEAGLKYFVLSALSSGLLLYGASMIYGFVGSTGFVAIASAMSAAEPGPSIGVIIGLVFLAAGLAFKISAVPFHMWTPDVYEGAPTPVTAFFSVAPKVAALGLFIRVLVGPFGSQTAQWQQIVMFISVASMLLGAFAAINQTNFKRLMAYSSIGHIGYALIGLTPGTPLGVRSVLIYMAIYIFMNLGTFAVILCMRQRGRMVEGIYDLAGYSKTHPGMAAALAALMFSMAGIPPLAGFFAKLFVFQAAVNAGLFWLAVVGVVTSVVSAFYYLRIVKIMYFDEAKEAFDTPMSWEVRAVLALSSLLIVLFFLAPGPLLRSAEAAAAVLFHG
ncbi:MAG: NADH-quinone oxidoreductase subunit NuoN [Rhodospirillaceae bacterium]|nr:NADH-quinone oxidoreductase subunit NuoN [Rhodospirillaceae bacterium]